ncbi:hypothetical protein EBB07_06825 [Paenibacillaceae bacterium]|nr:hypothetical protein EBB07_06825 [Paenibacillaceae bacterium]
MLFREAYQDHHWDDEIVDDLDYMIANFHSRGVPDSECAGTLRYLGDQEALEPAEYSHDFTARTCSQAVGKIFTSCSAKKQ